MDSKPNGEVVGSCESLVQRRAELRERLSELEDGAEALDYLFGEGAEGHRPDVIFLDLRLPRVDGLEVLKRIKGEDALKDVPVVVLTTSAADRDLASAYDSHVNAYVVKPADYDALDKMLRVTGKFWLEWNRRRK